MEAWHLWTVAAIVCIIVEMISPAFFFGGFALAALVTAAASAMGHPVTWQLAIFAVTAVLSLAMVRPLFVHYLSRGGDNRPVNADALIGQAAVVVDAIESDGTGRVKVGAEEWRAVSDDGRGVPAGTRVEITAVSSASLTVRPKLSSGSPREIATLP